jgi:aryl-alcohol dehydrogenase
MDGSVTVEIKAAVANAPHTPFVIEPLRLDAPRADEVLVKLAATGICHTDVAIVEQILPLPLPYVLGHEGAGVVVEVGNAVTSVAKGDHVVLTFGSCGTCRQCANGHPAYCSSQPLLNFSGRRSDGSATVHNRRGEPVNASFFGQSSFATHSISPVRNVIKVRSDAPLKFLGPLGCGLMTGAGSVLNVLKPTADSTFVIFGTGALGFAALFAAKLMGCKRIVAVDRVKSRLELARATGATEVIDTSNTDLDKALAEIGGVDHALDTTGVPKVLEAAIRSLNVCGQLALVGASPERCMSTDIMHMISGRVVRGVVEGDANPPEFIPFLVDKFLAGEFPIDAVSAFYPFERINAAVSDGVAGKTIKPIVVY